MVVDKLTYAGNLCNLEGLAGEPRCRFLRGDIADRDFVGTLFREHRPTWTVNFAAETHVDRSIDDPRPFLATNVAGTAELLECARAHYQRLEGSARSRFRYLQVSSDEVYGSAEGGSRFSEATACAPNSPYAASKAAADHWGRAYHRTYGLPTLTTRCSNNYGPFQFPEKLIPLMALNAMEARPLPIYGDGGHVRDWLHVEDHCAALLVVLQRGRPGDSYNVGGGNERTNLEMVDQVCGCLEALLPAAANPAMQRQGISSYASLKRRVPGPAGPRPPLRHRLRKDPQGAGLGSPVRPRGGARPNGRLVCRTPGVVPQGAGRQLRPAAAGDRGQDGVMRKGIILAGGSGTRLAPVTRTISKQLLPVYDKPMIYYPLSTLMQAGIGDILVITTPRDRPAFQGLLGDGSQWGLSLEYAVQPRPEGIAQAFLIARDFLEDQPAALVLGDNIFYGQGLAQRLRQASRQSSGATVFAYQVSDPQRYGVISFDEESRPTGLEEKPARPRSSFAVTGLYFYDGQAVGLASKLKPSARGELEISDLNREYLAMGQLRVEKLGRGVAWLDTGTHESLLQASVFIQTLQERQGLMVACPEEVALELGWIEAGDVRRMARSMQGSPYGRYLMGLVEPSVLSQK